MPPANIVQPAGEPSAAPGLKTLLLRTVTQPTAAAKAASRRRRLAIEPASGPADHSRHHVPRNAQS